jgi:hypothetical protein
MFSHCTDVKVVRFDTNENELRNGIMLDKSVVLEYDLGKQDNWYFIKFKVRINVINDETKDELLGYLSERMCVLNTTTIENDRPMLLDVISDTVLSAKIYCKQHSRVPFTGKNKFDADKSANEIFKELKEIGFYQ